jgi:hypothetical protein
MRRFLLLATAGALAALVATSSAAAKGPSTASLTGPGLDHAVPVKGEGEAGTGTPLGSLVQLGGFFPQTFLEAPDPTTRTRPTGNLGPRYRIEYRVPGPSENGNKLMQDVYPYAKTPVTYMRPGQRFWGVNHTHGGWFVAGPGLKVALVAAGLPESPPPPPQPASSGGSFPWAWLGAGVLAVVVLLAIVLRRRGIARSRMVRSTA